jgi:hypothetical protein
VLIYYLAHYPDMNVTTLAATQTQALVDAFETGTFQDVLRQYAIANNASQLLNVTVANVTVLETNVVTPAPKPNETASLTNGQIAGIIIGSIIGVILLIVLVYFLIREKRSELRITSQTKYRSNNELDRTLGDLVVIDERSPSKQQAPQSGYIDDTVTIHVAHDIERNLDESSNNNGLPGQQSQELTDGYLQIRL